MAVEREVTTVKKVDVMVDVNVPLRLDGTNALNTLPMVVPNARCWPAAGYP